MKTSATARKDNSQPVNFVLDAPTARAVKDFSLLYTGHFDNYSNSTQFLLYIALTSPAGLKNSIDSMTRYMVAECMPLQGGLGHVINSRVLLAAKHLETARRATK